MFWRILCNLNSCSDPLLVACNLTVVKMHGLSMAFWLTTLAWTQPPQSAASFTDWWFLAIHAVPAVLRKGTSSLIQFTIWEIWRHHNVQVFTSMPPDVHCLLTCYCVGRCRGVRPQGDYSCCPGRVVVFFGVLLALTKCQPKPQACNTHSFLINASARKAFVFSHKKKLIADLTKAE